MVYFSLLDVQVKRQKGKNYQDILLIDIARKSVKS